MLKTWAIAWKDALIRFSSRMELLFFIVLPMVFTLLLGGGLGMGAGQQDGRLPIAVINNAGSPLADEMIAALDASTTVRATVYEAAAADKALDDKDVLAVLDIPATFVAGGQDLALELRSADNDTNILAIEQAVNAAAARAGQALAAAQAVTDQADELRSFADQAERQTFFDDAQSKARALLDEAPSRVDVVVAAVADPIAYEPAENQSAGQLITWVFIPLIGISGLFAFEREQGTLRRMFVTPTRKSTVLLGTIGGQVVMALVQMALLVVFGMLVLKINWMRDPVALGAVLFASALAAGALGTMLGTFVKSERQAGGLSIMLGMVMAMMGGCWYPVELFPEAVRSAVQVLPTYWAMQGLIDVVLRGQGLAAVLPSVGILLGFATVFFAVGVARFRYE